MINIEILGKFYDNHSLSIINRQLITHLNNCKDFNIIATPLDSPNPNCNLDINTLKIIKKLSNKESQDDNIDIQLRHSYPPVWNWPSGNTDLKPLPICCVCLQNMKGKFS